MFYNLLVLKTFFKIISSSQTTFQNDVDLKKNTKDMNFFMYIDRNLKMFIIMIHLILYF